MKSFYKSFMAAGSCLAATLLAASTLAFAQNQPEVPAPAAQPAAQDEQQMQTTGGGWPRAAVNSPSPYERADPAQDQGEPPPPSPDDNRLIQNRPPYGARGQSAVPAQNEGPQAVPARLTIAPGTYITVRVNQYLSSDKNQTGDAFSATLVLPIVVNGVVVAEPGQTLGGQIVESQKAGRVEGVARLGVQLTELTLVDGQQVPIQSQLIARNGDTSVGRDAGAVAGTTAVGAAIGAGVGGGGGAAVGAGAGLLVSAIGVLVTRGHASVIYPEQVLTFKIQAPVPISTENAPMAFRYVQPNEYDNSNYRREPAPGPAYANAAPPPPSPYYYDYGYPSYFGYGYGYGYPNYWGPSVGFYFGGRGGYWGHGDGYWGRSYYRGGYGGGGYRGGGSNYHGGGSYHSGGSYHGGGGASTHSGGGHGGRR